MTPEELRAAYASGRVTPQRALIAEAASLLPGAFSATELAASVQAAQPGVGLATVYRAVSALEESGWLSRAGERAGAALYVRCADDRHHHHLVCTGCGRVEHAPCPVGPALAQTAEASGFRITGHDVTLYGLCSSCDASAKERA